MKDTGLRPTTEDELDAFVSIAIRRAEILNDSGSASASEAWQEVLLYEERLARITQPAEIAGGVARVGAVRAALASGQRGEAKRLATEYLAEALLPPERRAAINRAFDEDQDYLARRFPALARTGRLAELDLWRSEALAAPRVFPWAWAV